MRSEMGIGSLKISLMITMYNCKAALELVLLSAIRQSRLPDEILIADDGSDDDTRALIDSFRSRTKVPINHVWHEDIGFRKSTIQNLALVSTDCDYIVQIDGDIVMHPHFIADHARFAKEGCYLQGYRCKLDKETTDRMLAKKDIRFRASLKGLFSSQRTVRSILLNYLTLEEKLSMKRIIGCNTSFWRNDALLVNGYDEDMVGWGAQDQEFSARLMHNGIKQRRLRFSAREYHLDHPNVKRDPIEGRWDAFGNTLEKRLKRCANGIEKL